MAIGPIVGTFIGGRLLGYVPANVLLPALALIPAPQTHETSTFRGGFY